MALSTRTRLGPYEILSPLGAGGMGQLYRARDTRLGRDVAIKIIAPEYATDPGRLKRFQREARLASALNHANIVTVHDIGITDSVCYIAMEFVSGVSLRAMLRRGPLAVRQLLDIAVQVAGGLATAHASGIVHRDLKPDNVMVRPDGCVKILDFGLATLAEADATSDDDTRTSTNTRPGVALGTPGYMSPEQLTGNRVDFRSDQFAFGSMLYEMATGRKPFAGKTVSQTLLAIVADEPEDVGSLNPKIPAPLRWVIRRCLCKDPGQRYAATEDLARELRTLRDHLDEASATTAPRGEGSGPRRRGLQGLTPLRAALFVLAALIAGFVVARFLPAPADSFPSFQPLTFRRGEVSAARFAPDGRSIVYAFSANGPPGDIYSASIDGGGFRPLGFSDSQLLAVSRSGELAVALNWRWTDPYIGLGTLARLPLEGGAARAVVDDVVLADWGPDVNDLAVVRHSGGSWRLEFPIAKTLYVAGEDRNILGMRVSPRGNLIVIAEIEGANGGMSVVTVDLAGRSHILSTGWRRIQGLAWTADAREIWFVATKSGIADVNGLYAVTLDGKERVVGRFPGSISIHDIAADGHVLLTQGKARREMSGLLAGDRAEHDLTWLDYSFPADLSADGSRLLFVEGGAASAPKSSLWLRATDSPLPVRLGEGDRGAISRDGKWVAVIPQGPANDHDRARLNLIPTGTGQERHIDLHGVNPEWTRWVPDGERVVIAGTERGRRLRNYVVDLRGGSPRPITPEGSAAGLITPDGRWLLTARDGLPTLFPIDSGEPRSFVTPANEAALREALRTLDPLAWADNDHTIFVGRSGVPARILRLDLQTGQTTPWKEIVPSDTAGVRTVSAAVMAPGGRAYVSTFRRELSDLYLVDGLK